MANLSNRRNFLKASAALAAVLGTQTIAGAKDDRELKAQEYYEFRAYRTADADKKAILERYLEKALIPEIVEGHT